LFFSFFHKKEVFNMSTLTLFGNTSTLKPQVLPTPMSMMTDKLQTAVSGNGGSFADSSVVRAAVSLESYSTDTRMQLESSLQNLKAVIKTAAKTIKGFPELTLAQENAAVAAGILASNPRQSLQAQPFTQARLQAAAGQDPYTSVIGNAGIPGAMDARPAGLSLEAYDEKENRNAISYSVSYNMQAARQDDFGEAFFPTVVVTPENVGFMVSIRLHYVQDEVRRSLTGSLSSFGRKNIIKAVVDHTILRNDQTRLTPVVRGGGGANDSTDKFVADADVAPYTITIDTHPVQTAPLKMGKKFDLLAISQTDTLIQAGVLDQTDAIDSSLRLGALYVKFGPNAGNAVVKFSTKDLAGSDFNNSVQGNTRQLQLNFNSDALRMTSTTAKVDGATIAQLTAMTDKVVRLSVGAFGAVVQDTGLTVVNASDVSVFSVTDASGSLLDIKAGAGATIAALFAGATAIGYDLIGHRTNSNRRQRGQLIDTQFVNSLYTVPQLPPITALRPIGETEANDNSLLASLITTTKIRTSNAAVTSLLEAIDILKEFVNTADSTLNQPEILGVARYIVNSSYLEKTLDVSTQLDSLTSSERAVNMVDLIINQIRDMAYRLYTSSAYKAAADALYDGAAPKPLLIVGCDPILMRYLTLNGDTRTFGDHFDVKLVSTLDQRMRGKIIFTFGMESSYGSGVPNPMHFGAMAWKPELTLMMPMQRNGGISYELTVSPSFRHIVNLPIMGMVHISGIENIIASKNPIDFHTT
jgi:hypothetical protein